MQIKHMISIESASRLNTVLVRYGYFVPTKRYKNPERKPRSDSRDIDENKLVHWLGERFGIIRRLAAEWRRIPFYDDIGTSLTPEAIRAIAIIVF